MKTIFYLCKLLKKSINKKNSTKVIQHTLWFQFNMHYEETIRLHDYFSFLKITQKSATLLMTSLLKSSSIQTNSLLKLSSIHTTSPFSINKMSTNPIL